MIESERYRLLGLPVMHTVGLAVWSLLQPRESWTPLLLWGIWVPVISWLFSPRILLLVFLGAAPFLAFHVLHRHTG